MKTVQAAPGKEQYVCALLPAVWSKNTLMHHPKHVVTVVGSTVRNFKGTGGLRFLVLSVAFSLVTSVTSNKLLLLPSHVVSLVLVRAEL